MFDICVRGALVSALVHNKIYPFFMRFRNLFNNRNLYDELLIGREKKMFSSFKFADFGKQ